MTDKKDDDLNIDDKLADDLIDDMDDIDSLEDLDEIDDFEDMDNDFDETDIDDTKDPNKDDDGVDSDNEDNSNSHEERDIEELDEEISSLNTELDELEEENLESDDIDDDDTDLEEDDPKEDSTEEGVDDEEEDDLDALEAKEQKKKALIMRGATGAFIIMVGAFAYNLMFAGELPNEQNEISPVAQNQNTVPQPVSIDKDIPSMVKSPDPVESEVFKDSEDMLIGKKPISLSNKDKQSSKSDGETLLATSDDAETSEQPDKEHSERSASKGDADKVEIAQQPEREIDLDRALLDKLVNDLSKGQGVHINSQGKIVGQDNMTTYELYVGQTIPYYSYEVDVVSIFFDGELALLSNGTYIDKNRIKVDENLMKMANTQKELEAKEQELREKREQEEKDRALRIAEERAREEERMKAQEQQKLQEEKLRKALERINTLANEVESNKKKEVEAPKPKLLEGWSINGEFKAIRNGFVLNGYLVRDSDGNFYKMLVGDTHEEFGIIRGYDGNGRFFIGNSYIL